MASLIAVTGALGHFGRVVTAHLIDLGYRVRGIDRAAPSPTTAKQAGIEYACHDLADLSALQTSLAGCDGVVHLAAIPGLGNGFSDEVVYINNTTISYNVLCAAAALGIRHVCLASSVNAIGGAFGPRVHYEHFPVDEQHPCFAMDAYSLSKWVMEQQADSVARRHPTMTIASMRFHALPLDDPPIQNTIDEINAPVTRTLWGFTNAHAAAHAVAQFLRATYNGHEVFFIVAPRTNYQQSSRELAQHYYPKVPIRADLSDNTGFYNCDKAKRLLGWRHNDDTKGAN